MQDDEPTYVIKEEVELIPKSESTSEINGVQKSSSSNFVLLNQKKPSKNVKKAVSRCISAATKGFAIGAGLKGGLALFGILMKSRSKNSSRKRLDQELRPLTSSLVETLRYGMFLGTFSGGYCCVDELLTYFCGLESTSAWRPFVSGAIAGPALLLTGRDTGHISLALYIFLRAAVLAVRCGIKSREYGWIFSICKWNHSDAFLMCLSSAQILSAWILAPHSLPPSYVSFINKHGGKDPKLIQAVKAVADTVRPLPGMHIIKSIHQQNGHHLDLDPNITIPCPMLHPGQGCVSHFLTFFPTSYLRSFPVYLPVYAIPALLVHRRALLEKPAEILTKAFIGASRSSLFLAAFCSSCWLWTCAIHQLTGKCSPLTLALGTFPPGLAVLCEKKSRRMELALYCLSRAMESFGIWASEWKTFRFLKRMPRRMDVILFSLSTAVIMHCYNNERDVFKSKYLNVLDWVFGLPRENSSQNLKQNEMESGL